jgi:hypothetical protein
LQKPILGKKGGFIFYKDGTSEIGDATELQGFDDIPKQRAEAFRKLQEELRVKKAEETETPPPAREETPEAPPKKAPPKEKPKATRTQRPRPRREEVRASENSTKLIVIGAALLGVLLGYLGAEYFSLAVRGTSASIFGALVSAVSGFLFGYGAYRIQKKSGEPVTGREMMRVLQSALALVAVCIVSFFLVAFALSTVTEDLPPETLLLFITVPISLFFGHRMYLALSSDRGGRAAKAKRVMLTLFGGVVGVVLGVLVIQGVLVGTPYLRQLETPLFLFSLVLGSAVSWFIGKKLFFTGESNAEGAESEAEPGEATTEAKKEAPKGAARGVDAPLSQKSRVRLSVILGALLGCLSPEITFLARSALSLEFLAFPTLQNIIFVIVALVSVGIFYEVLPAIKRKLFPTHRAGRPLQIIFAVLTFFAAGAISLIGYLLLINYIRTTLIRSDAVILPAALPYVGLVLAIATAFFVATGYLFSGAKRL